MAFSTPDLPELFGVIPKLKRRIKRRQNIAVTAEVLVKLLGYDDSVILKSVRWEGSRDIVYFYLEEIDGRNGFPEVPEAQEAPEKLPPVWQKMIDDHNAAT